MGQRSRTEIVTAYSIQETIMPRIANTKSKRHWSAGVTVGVMLAATLALGTFTGSASADDHRDRDYHHRDWNSGYYRAPPVVYGTPYYAPPVVYGSPFGLNINIR
jgi:hypothetical protein